MLVPPSDLGTYHILLLYFVQTAKLVNIDMEIITAIISTKLGNRFRLWHLLKINYYYIDIRVDKNRNNLYYKYSRLLSG
jgi:hypothetical protein